MSRADGTDANAGGGRKRSSLRAGFVIVVVALGWSIWSQVQLQSRLGNLEESASGEISDLRAAVSKIDPNGKAEPSGRVPLALVQSRMDSVYLITRGTKEGMEGPLATAWVIAEGVLATNAHVAELFDKTGKQNLYVRNRDSAEEPNRVVKVKLHAGYEKFVEAVEDYQPYLTTPDGTPYGLIALKGYDIALLYVERPLELARPIPVAPLSAIENLKSGDPLVQIGFPLEGVVNNDVQRTNPNPRVQHGHITAMTHFLQGKIPVKHAHMVVHNVASTGGNSGSPMLNINGEVVSIESHDLGFYGESGAQRADLAVELLEGKDLSNVRTIHEPQWSKMLNSFKSGHDIIPWSVAQSLEDDLGKVKFTQETDKFRYDVSQKKMMPLCLEGEEPKDIIGRVLEGRTNGPRVQLLRSEPVSPGRWGQGRVNGLTPQKCPELAIDYRGTWHSRNFKIEKPGPYLLYAYDYSIEGPCSDVTIVGKPAGATTIQFISTPDVGHSYAVAGVPEDVKSLEVHYLVDLKTRSQRCADRKGKGRVNIGLVRFEKVEEEVKPNLLSDVLGLASLHWSNLKTSVREQQHDQKQQQETASGS